MANLFTKPSVTGNKVQTVTGTSSLNETLDVPSGFVQAYFYSASAYTIGGTLFPAGLAVNLEFGGKQHDSTLTVNPGGNALYYAITYASNT